MKTAKDILVEIDIPCYYCRYAFTYECDNECVNPLMQYAIQIAQDMVLGGEY